ncbi:histidine phosphatase family protein [Pseudomonas mandelii]|uniref:histidine phosphatase family protein n=1 Tax=Pseudomonas mandelii TaxID=75612 RepID=UPI00224B3156|nr:histidine phosphatase family protein [Pseudomonas mandelii]MCX2901286.1 histidine phosphatase family protein [Pseudomonas mandelii]
MHLHVIRHGETAPNLERRYVGSLDPQLTEKGRAQAQELVSRLPVTIDAIIVSPRLRAQQTAQILNAHLNLPLLTMDCFAERNVGVFEGLTQTEARERFPQLWSQNITRQWHSAPTGGESVAEVVSRVREGLIELATAYPSQTVVLVAHGFVAKVIRALEKSDFSDFFDWQLANGKVLALENFRTPSCTLEHLRTSLQT